MKSTEFRIGNLYSQFGNIHQVSWATLKDLENAPNIQLWCRPISLTEEWLLKMGFVKSSNNTEFYTFDKDKLSIHLKSKQYENGRTYFNSWCIIESQIMFVHQLQNLYRVLTNNELTIKL